GGQAPAIGAALVAGEAAAARGTTGLVRAAAGRGAVGVGTAAILRATAAARAAGFPGQAARRSAPTDEGAARPPLWAAPAAGAALLPRRAAGGPPTHIPTAGVIRGATATVRAARRVGQAARVTGPEVGAAFVTSRATLAVGAAVLGRRTGAIAAVPERGDRSGNRKRPRVDENRAGERPQEATTSAGTRDQAGR